jgi:hypothetical protein
MLTKKLRSDYECIYYARTKKDAPSRAQLRYPPQTKWRPEGQKIDCLRSMLAWIEFLFFSHCLLVDQRAWQRDSFAYFSSKEK